MTCFGVSLDGESAFPSVERDIQVRELYSIGERGDILNYSRNTYLNTLCHIKQNGILSRRIEEHKGNRQGHVRASGHFKAYMNPALLSLEESGLGFNIGLENVPIVCVADDAYLISGSPSQLQSALDVISHYAKRYHIQFNADKTKVVVCGSKIDMQYFQDTSHWTIDGQKLEVVEDNEHLGLIVSGLHEEQKNIDMNIIKCRNSVFSLLGAAYSYKCLLSPIAQCHIWRTCSLPILLSGLSALPIMPSQIKTLEVFHNKMLRGFLKLSQSSPIPALHFLLGEPPAEAILHMRTLSLFYNLWSNPECTVFRITMYILKMCKENSLTWANHVRLLCLRYDLPSPLSLLQTPVWSKDSWNMLVKTKILAWFERKLRLTALSNSKMIYLNVQLNGLSGRPHPVLGNIVSTQDVKKMRVHLKFLTMDFHYLYQPSLCNLCAASNTTTDHVLVTCRHEELVEIRARLFPELLNIVLAVQPSCALLNQFPPPHILTQFLLDCSSANLPQSYRIPAHNPRIDEVFSTSRDWCFAIYSARCHPNRKAVGPNM